MNLLTIYMPIVNLIYNAQSQNRPSLKGKETQKTYTCITAYVLFILLSKAIASSHSVAYYRWQVLVSSTA